jgi:hypothetical protein
MNRNFVQKALVVIANLPFYGLIAEKMQPATQAYFEQRDFEMTEIITSAFESLKQTLANCNINDLYIGFSTRMMIYRFKEKVMMLCKLILLQGRIIVFSKKPSLVSAAIYSLLALFPGQLCFGNFGFCSEYSRHLQQFGLPFELFTSDYSFHSYFSIFQIAELERNGYLIGCTNQIMIEHPKSKPHAVLNLETEKIKFNLPGKLANCIKLNSHESKFIKDLKKVSTN